MRPNYPPELQLVTRYLALPVVFALALASCAAPRPIGDGTRTADEPAWKQIPIADGRSVVERMWARYQSRFISSMTFRQLNTLYPVSGGEQKSEWLEYAAIPGRLRIEYLPAANRNGVIVSNGRIATFENGRRTRYDPYIHPLMVLLYDVHVLAPDSTVALLDSLHFNLRLVRHDSWQGRPVFVVGAPVGDTTSSQFWVDAERLVTVRVIQTEKRGTRSVLSDTRVDKFVEYAGALIGTEILFLRDGRPYFREVYTEVKVNVPVAPELFEPAKWSETGSFR